MTLLITKSQLFGNIGIKLLHNRKEGVIYLANIYEHLPQGKHAAFCQGRLSYHGGATVSLPFSLGNYLMQLEHEVITIRKFHFLIFPMYYDASSSHTTPQLYPIPTYPSPSELPPD